MKKAGTCSGFFSFLKLWVSFTYCAVQQSTMMQPDQHFSKDVFSWVGAVVGCYPLAAALLFKSHRAHL